MKWSKHTVKILFALCLPSSSYAWFAYDKAAYAGQSGQWQQAMQCMKDVINQNPHDPHALYDAGVAAYRNKDFVQAQAYFNQASVACAADNPQLQERAHFNEGNTLAQLQHYQDAIDSYEKVLTLNADNQQAQENIALLKKLLAQQQEQEKNKDQQKNEDQKNNSDQQEQKDNQDNQQQEQRDQQDPQDQQGNQDNQQQENQDNAQESADNQPGDEEDQDRDGKKPSPAQQQQDQQQKREKEQQQQSRKEQQEQSAPQRAQQQSKESSGKDVQSGTQEHAPQEVSAWLDAILSERDKQDEAVNKALIKMQTARQPQGSPNAAAHNW